MGSIYRILFCFLNLCFFITHTYAEDILGCGGFVKSEIDINFSQVEVKLYTKQGSLKDHTDCAPNNGYYFLPLYDKGEYVLKIEPPTGWSFEPKEVNLNFDGTTDPCSLGKDINFVFKGFAINGKVVSAGSETGPKGVKIALLPSGNPNSTPIREFVTLEGGAYYFSPVLPGKYLVKALHPKWFLSRDSVAVIVNTGNVDVAVNSLVIAGYDVSGSVTSDDEPIKGVSFVLFQAEGMKPVGGILGCDKTPLSGFKSPGNLLCHVNSNDKGVFTFPSLPPGGYKVVPHYEGPQNIKFDVRPVQLTFVVVHNSLEISTKFQVKGFSVSGRVLLKAGGKGIEGAAVLLDNKVVTQTKADGHYHLENMKAGSYNLQVQARDMKFDEMNVKITPNTPQLSEVYPSSFKVCGRVAPHQLTPGVAERGVRKVLVSSVSGDRTGLGAETRQETGEFCLFLKPGKYEIRVFITDQERSKGLQYFPAARTVDVVDHPVLTGIEFTQLKVKLSGQISCLSTGNCGEIPVTLEAVSGEQSETQVFVAKVISRGGVYMFDNILPGRYSVSVDKDDWCWESTDRFITVGPAEGHVPKFVQTGFTVTFVSSHDTQVVYKLQGVEGSAASSPLAVRKGVTRSCVSSPGTYEFRPIGCHGYERPTVEWSSASTPSSTIQLTAVSHLIRGRILSLERVTDLYLNVLSNQDNELRTRLGPLEAEGTGTDSLSYPFALGVEEGESLTLEPQAGVLLFTPMRSTLVGATDCVDNAVEFRAERGRILAGQVLPQLAGVRISVITEGREEAVVTVETGPDGRYRIGPLPGGVHYKLLAEKEGYILSKTDEQGNFDAHKLAEVIVEVMDKEDGKPLQGVLLSLSGGESFRRNSQTSAAGKMTFSSLSPGEYFLRPMMKEYRFEPPSRMITVKEGATVSVKLSGNRVAFSAYGMVTSLAGDPEEGVVVEAVGLDKCSQLQEETSSEPNGQFRIRGLKPKCEYTVRMKRGGEVNRHIQRATPDAIPVKVTTGDVTSLKLLVFHPVTQMDVTVLIQASSPEYLRTLKAKLCREEAPDSPVHLIKLEPYSGKPPTSSVALVPFPPLPVDGRGYFLQLESSLSRATHSYTTHAVHFKANGSFKHVRLPFRPEQKNLEQEMVQTPYLLLLLVLAALLVYLNQEKVVPLLNRAAKAMNTSGVGGGGGGGRVSNVSVDTDRSDAIMVEPVSNLTKRKLKVRKT